MTSININNGISSSTTYSVSTGSDSEITSLQKEKQSLQKEVQELQSQLASSSGDSSETVQVEIDSIQSQISTIESKISSLQNKSSENSNSNNKSNKEVNFNNSENPQALKNSLVTLDETTKLLKNEILLDKAKGLNTDSKDDMLENMKVNIESISSKLGEFNQDSLFENKINSQNDLVGSLIDNHA